MFFSVAVSSFQHMTVGFKPVPRTRNSGTTELFVVKSNHVYCNTLWMSILTEFRTWWIPSFKFSSANLCNVMKPQTHLVSHLRDSYQDLVNIPHMEMSLDQLSRSELRNSSTFTRLLQFPPLLPLSIWFGCHTPVRFSHCITRWQCRDWSEL